MQYTNSVLLNIMHGVSVGLLGMSNEYCLISRDKRKDEFQNCMIVLSAITSNIAQLKRILHNGNIILNIRL